MANAPKQRRNSGIANLKPFPKGKSGNPKGRPKGEDLNTKLRRVLDEPDETYGTKADKMIAMAVDAGMNKDFRFFKEIMERMVGKVPDRIANADGNELVVKVLRGVSMDDI